MSIDELRSLVERACETSGVGVPAVRAYFGTFKVSGISKLTPEQHQPFAAGLLKMIADAEGVTKS